VSSHSAFLRCVFSFGHVGGVKDAPEQWLSAEGDGAGANGVAGAGPHTDADAPVVHYGDANDDKGFEELMRRDWENCELRTFLVAYL